MNRGNQSTMMTYYPSKSGSNGQFKLFSSDSRRRRRATNLFHKNSSMKRSWLVLSYPSLKYNYPTNSDKTVKQRSSSSSSKYPNSNHIYSSYNIRPTTSCSIYSSYLCPSSSVIDSPVIYPKINPPPSSSAYSFDTSTSGNCSPLSSNLQESELLAETLLLPCFPTTGTICSSESESSPSSSILSSGSSPTSSSSISYPIPGNSIKSYNNNTFNNSIRIVDQNEKEESRIGSGTSSSSNKGMASNLHVVDSRDCHGTYKSCSYGKEFMMKENGCKTLNANGKIMDVSDERASDEEEREKKNAEEKLNESASLTVTSKTLPSSSIKSTHNNSVKGKNVSKQGCSSKFIDSSRELVQSLFYPSSNNHHPHHHSESKKKSGEGEEEKKYQKVNGQEKKNFIVTKKEEEGEDLGQHSKQYNNNYHEQKSKNWLLNVGTTRKMLNNTVEVKSNRNNHHLNTNTNSKKVLLPRKLLVTKKNKNHIFYSPFNPHHPQTLSNPSTYSTHPPSTFIIPIHRSTATRYKTHPPHLSDQGMNTTVNDDYDQNEKKKQNKHNNFEHYGHKPLPLLHFKDDEPTTVNLDPSLHPGQEEGSITGHDDSSKCKNCNCKVRKGIKGFNNSSSYNDEMLPPRPLNVTIISQPSSASSSFIPPPNNPSPPESLDSCSLFCSTSNSSSSNSTTPSSSPTSASPTTIQSNSSPLHSCPQQKQGILKTNKSNTSTTTGNCNCVTRRNCCKTGSTNTIHDHLERLAITNDPNDKSGVVMIPTTTTTSVHSTSTPSNSSFDPSSPSSSSSAASCCSTSAMNQGWRTGSSSSSSGKKVHFADMCYERINYYNENDEETDGEEEDNSEERSKNEDREVDVNPTNHRSSLSSSPSSTDHHHSSSLVIISEKIIPGPKRTCTFKEISV